MAEKGEIQGLLCLAEGSVVEGSKASVASSADDDCRGTAAVAQGLGRRPLPRERLGGPQAPKSVAGAPVRSRHEGASERPHPGQGPWGGARTPCRLGGGVLLWQRLVWLNVSGGGGSCGAGPESPLLLPTRHCAARRSC